MPVGGDMQLIKCKSLNHAFTELVQNTDSIKNTTAALCWHSRLNAGIFIDKAQIDKLAGSIFSNVSYSMLTDCWSSEQQHSCLCDIA